MRLKEFDYCQDGAYFFTICTKDKRHYFGQIRKDVMGLNNLGCIVWEQWYWLAKQYDYVRLDAFIVMPNHVHGILIIEHPEIDHPKRVGPELARGNSALLAERLPETGEDSNSFDLYRLIRILKSRCSKEIHKAGYYSFAWQESFYERVILHEKSLESIQNYIYSNPARWYRDRNNSC